MTVIGSGKQITPKKSILLNSLTRMRKQSFSIFVVTYCYFGQYLKQFWCQRFLFGLKMTVIESGKQITPKKSILFNSLTRMREQPFSFFVVTYCYFGQYLKQFWCQRFLFGLKLTVIGSGKQLAPKTSILSNSLTPMREQPFFFFVVTYC